MSLVVLDIYTGTGRIGGGSCTVGRGGDEAKSLNALAELILTETFAQSRAAMGPGGSNGKVDDQRVFAAAQGRGR